jgi:hypothetical protein
LLEAEVLLEIAAATDRKQIGLVGAVGIENNAGRKFKELEGTLIRHASIGSASAILPLTVPMIESSLETLLVTAVGEAPLLSISLLAAQRAAIALSSVAAAANPKHFAASTDAAKALT